MSAARDENDAAKARAAVFRLSGIRSDPRLPLASPAILLDALSVVDRVANDRAGHAMAAAAPAAKFGADNADDFNSCLAEKGIGVGVAVVGEDDAGRSANQIRP